MARAYRSTLCRRLRDRLEDPRTVGPYFDVDKDASPEEFAAEAARHPVFRLRPL